MNGLDGVHQEVEEHLLDLGLVGQNVAIRWALDGKVDVVGEELGVEEIDDAANGIGKVDALALGGLAAEHGAEAADDRAGALGVLNDASRISRMSLGSCRSAAMKRRPA